MSNRPKPAHMLIVSSNENTVDDLFPEIIYFDSLVDADTFYRFYTRMFPNSEFRLSRVFHIYSSGYEWMEDYGLVVDPDEEGEE